MDEKTFEELVEMFNSEGWKYFVKSIDDLKEALIDAAPDGAITNDQWQFARGEIKQLRAVSGFETLVRAIYAEQERQASEALNVEDDADAYLI